MSSDLLYLIYRSTLDEIADAIRTKTGKSDPIPVSLLKSEILSITGGGAQPQLYAPTVSISDGILTIQDSEKNGAFTTEFDIYVNGELKATVVKNENS